MSIARVTADLTAGDSFSAAGSADWHDIPDGLGNILFTGPLAMVGEEPEGAWYRFGIAPGEHSSGTASGRLSQ